MLSDWQIQPDGSWAGEGFEGRWVIEAAGAEWCPVPPNGRAYPYALIAPLFRAPCLASTKHAARDCMSFLNDLIGVPTLRKSGPASTPGAMHRQFMVTSCGVSFSVEQRSKEGGWICNWSAWDGHGKIERASLGDLIAALREPFHAQVGYCPPGLRTALIAEDQRIEARCRTLTYYSKAEGILEAARNGEDVELAAVMSWGGRAEAYSLSLGMQVAQEVAIAQQASDPDVYANLI